MAYTLEKEYAELRAQRVRLRTAARDAWRIADVYDRKNFVDGLERQYNGTERRWRELSAMLGKTSGQPVKIQPAAVSRAAATRRTAGGYIRKVMVPER